MKTEDNQQEQTQDLGKMNNSKSLNSIDFQLVIDGEEILAPPTATIFQVLQSLSRMKESKGRTPKSEASESQPIFKLWDNPHTVSIRILPAIVAKLRESDYLQGFDLYTTFYSNRNSLHV